MKNVRILDCTLRDGGRIIDCNFLDKDIVDITTRLTDAHIDIVEVGFLRDWHNVEYNGNSTFFTKVEQIKSFIPQKRKETLYVAFVDYGMFDFDSLSEYDGSSIDGIRVGFTKKNYKNSKDDLLRCLNVVKEKGYKLFIQGVNSLGYSDAELLEIIEVVNKIHPYGFGIVDTYGAMYVDDVRRIFSLVDHNLIDDICIDFHSHNNFQLSFAFAQEVIALSKGVRKVVIDATLNGMGKCAGNLNTELIVDYLVRNMGYNYDFDSILDIIDEYMYSIKEKCFWGYTIPSMMAGVYKSHPNNVIYLTEKFRLATKDIKYIMSMIEPEMRQIYNYDNIQEKYKVYNDNKVDDRDSLIKLHTLLDGKNILVLLPGNSIVEYRNIINEYVEKNNPFVISANFVCDIVSKSNRIAFFGSEKRYKKSRERNEEQNVVVVSNIKQHCENDIVVNYESLIERGNEDFDNTTIMLLNLLKRIGILKFTIAGFDGYDRNKQNYFDDITFEESRFETRYESITANMRKMLKDYASTLVNKSDMEFLTPSVYEDIFCNQ